MNDHGKATHKEALYKQKQASSGGRATAAPNACAKEPILSKASQGFRDAIDVWGNQ